MHILRLALIWLMLALPASADVPVPQNIEETLELMRDAYQADPRVSDVTVNIEERYLSFHVDGSQTLISFPDNLHLLLTQAGTEAERAEILHKAAQAMIESGVAVINDGPVNVARVIPVIRHQNYGTGLPGEDGGQNTHQSLNSRPEKTQTSLISFPFIGDMRIFLVEDAPQFVKFLTLADLQPLDLTASALMLEATKNTRDNVKSVQIDTENGLNILVFDGHYETSFLTVPTFWDTIDAQLGTIVAVVIARDLVVFVDGDDATAMADLRDLIKPNVNQFTYPVSTTLITWNDGRWSLYD